MGEKIVSVLRQPLFTFTFTLPDMSKSEKIIPLKNEMPDKVVKKKKGVVKRTFIKSKQPSMKNETIRRSVHSRVFTRNKNPEEYKKILFVLKACDKKSGRAFAEVVHIEATNNGSRLVATDGKRLHVTTIPTRIKPGDYKIVLSKEMIMLGQPVKNVGFPNWERVVPVDVSKRGVMNLVHSRVNEIDRIDQTFTKLSGEKVNPKYLMDLRNKSWVIYCQKEKQKALMLKEYGAYETFAVIMPLA